MLATFVIYATLFYTLLLLIGLFIFGILWVGFFMSDAFFNRLLFFLLGLFISGIFFNMLLFFPMGLFMIGVFFGGLLFFLVGLFILTVFGFSFQSSNLFLRTKKISL